MQLGSLQYPRNPMKGAWSTSTSSRSLRAVTARFLPRALVFLALIRAAGQCFSWPRRGFHLKKAAAVHFRLVGSLSILAIETLLALRGAELPSWWGVLQLSLTRT